MLDKIRTIINSGSYDNRTKQLLKLRYEIYNCTGIKRFLKVRKYNSLLHFFSADIPIEAKIGKGLILPHGGNGIFISRGAVIGCDCVIFQQVTIGSNTLSESKGVGAPTIGNGVYIGAGAKIIGNVRIGDNVRIGANAVVVKDIPDFCTVVSQPARVIIKSKQKNCFVSY